MRVNCAVVVIIQSDILQPLPIGSYNNMRSPQGERTSVWDTQPAPASCPSSGADGRARLNYTSFKRSKPATVALRLMNSQIVVHYEVRQFLTFLAAFKLPSVPNPHILCDQLQIKQNSILY